MLYTCRACRARTKNWQGDDPRCAFDNEDHRFQADNWNCATVNALRELVYEGQVPMPASVDYRYCDDQKFATVQIDGIDNYDEAIGLALWLTWYKSRGSTDAIWVLDSTRPPRAPSEDEVLAVLHAHGIYPTLDENPS